MSLIGAGTTSAQETPAVACALARAQLVRAGDWGRRFQRAALVPSLSAGARYAEGAVPGLAARSLEVFAWASWPLERAVRLGTGDLGPLATRRAQLAEEAAARARRVDELRARPAAPDLRGAVDDELDLEEADAALDALDGHRWAGGCR